MKRLSTGVLAALIATTCGLTAIAAPSASQVQGNTGQPVIAQSTDSMPAANFGSPPSGQIPILFNDHHVYATPDDLKQGRVLAALVKGGTVLIPLRSMFEQMGASVSYDPASKTVTVSKPGSEVKVTVGQPEVVINGESRPLDVPPIMWHGNVLVPIRVISEGMGAYVQWVPDQRVVVVRYIPPTPPPTPAPTEAPTEAPTVAPTPTPAPVLKPYKELFIAGDYLFSPKVYNEFSPGNTGTSSYQVHGAFEFDALGLPWMIEGNFQSYQYPHDAGNVTIIGSSGATFVPGFDARQSNVDAHLGLKVADPRIYIGVGYLWTQTDYGYPTQSAVGFGLEKLPDLDHSLSVFGSAYYYPNTKGIYGPADLELAYNILKYQVGIDYVIGKSPIFIEAGWQGIDANAKTNAPVSTTENGPFAGIGIKF